MVAQQYWSSKTMKQSSVLALIVHHKTQYPTKTQKPVITVALSITTEVTMVFLTKKMNQYSSITKAQKRIYIYMIAFQSTNS